MYKNLQSRKNTGNHPGVYEEQNGLTNRGVYKNEWTIATRINTDDTLKCRVNKCIL